MWEWYVAIGEGIFFLGYIQTRDNLYKHRLFGHIDGYMLLNIIEERHGKNLIIQFRYS